MPHPKTFSQKAGLVLTEALVAVTTLGMAVLALGSITTNSISTTILSKDYLVASGLLDEGDEVVQSISYTNWLLKPADKLKCWLRLVPDNLSDFSCVNNVTSNSNYVAILNKGVWQMQAANVDLDLDQNLNTNNNFQVYLNSDPKSPGYFSSLNSVNGPAITKSKFFSSIKFTDVAADNSQATYTVSVQWKDGAKTHTMSKTTILYNYP
ncbi:hypothetical protein HZA40_05440 [Candidatus Peregrinibacteria bacterium]|nr:hypothetical protein [Candidatus Peregrinibacteria bacterium]